MVIIVVAMAFAVAIAVDLLLVKRLAEKKAMGMAKAAEIPAIDQAKELLFNEGHAWMRVLKADVALGLDDFAQRFVGTIEKIDAPKPGSRIKKGEKLWTIRFGNRSFSQAAPVTGRVIEVNERLVKDPALVNRSPYKEGWIVKVRPESLGQEIPELSNATRFERWTDLQKAKYFREFFPDLGVVYGDGGELIPGAARQIDEKTWEKLSKRLFGNE